jgi:hypothetical protein
MTYTDVNQHDCCNGPRPEDAHAADRPPPYPHAATHLTNNDRLRWKTDGRPPANGPPTTAPQQRRHSASTPARGPPRTPTPRPSPQPPPPPTQRKGQVSHQVPITEQNWDSIGSAWRPLRSVTQVPEGQVKLDTSCVTAGHIRCPQCTVPRNGHGCQARRKTVTSS